MILGIETSSAIASVAVGNDKEIRSELIVQAGLTHSEKLVPHIEAVLTTGKVKKSDITGIAVTIGPGSFTGLRIGKVLCILTIGYALSLMHKRNRSMAVSMIGMARI